MKEFTDVYCWNSNPGEAFKVKQGVFILKTPMGKYEVACKGDPRNTTWDCCIKMSNVPGWGLLPKHESEKPEVKAGDLAYMDSDRFNKGLLRMVTGVNNTVFRKYSAMTPYSKAVEWHKADLHTSAEDLEFMCNEAHVLSDMRAGRPKIGDTVWAWKEGDTRGVVGVYVNNTGSKTRPYQVKFITYTGFFENIILHANNAQTVEGYLDSALAIFDDGSSKSDTLANLLDMSLLGLRRAMTQDDLFGKTAAALDKDANIKLLRNLIEDIRSDV